MKLISVHTPKAGGTSIRLSLEKAFGAGFCSEYSDDPANPASERNINPARFFSRCREFPENVQCLHGHFHPGQFNLRQDVFLFTMLRHPVDNIISIYTFWKNLESQGQPLHDYFLREKLDIIEMACLPILRWLYSRTYFGGFDMGRFNLIGQHENRKEALERLSAAMGVYVDEDNHDNRSPRSQEREILTSNPMIIQRLHAILSDDIRFYENYCVI